MLCIPLARRPAPGAKLWTPLARTEKGANTASLLRADSGERGFEWSPAADCEDVPPMCPSEWLEGRCSCRFVAEDALKTPASLSSRTSTSSEEWEIFLTLCINRDGERPPNVGVMAGVLFLSPVPLTKISGVGERLAETPGMLLRPKMLPCKMAESLWHLAIGGEGYLGGGEGGAIKLEANTPQDAR